MESIFFVISYTSGFFNETRKKISVIFSNSYHFLLNIFRGRTKSKDVEDVQELTNDEYNRRFGRFFPKSSRKGEFVMLTNNFISGYDWREAQSVSSFSNSHLTFDDIENILHHEQALARIHESIDQCSNPLRTDNPFTNGFLDNPRNEMTGVSYN